jgi:hypothetical protein
MAQLIGAPVKFTVAKLCISKAQRYSIRTPLSLVFNLLVHLQARFVFCGCVIPLHQQLVPGLLA